MNENQKHGPRLHLLLLRDAEHAAEDGDGAGAGVGRRAGHRHRPRFEERPRICQEKFPKQVHQQFIRLLFCFRLLFW